MCRCDAKVAMVATMQENNVEFDQQITTHNQHLNKTSIRTKKSRT
jgi:hypothetical protein